MVICAIVGSNRSDTRRGRKKNQQPLLFSTNDREDRASARKRAARSGATCGWCVLNALIRTSTTATCESAARASLRAKNAAPSRHQRLKKRRAEKRKVDAEAWERHAEIDAAATGIEPCADRLLSPHPIGETFADGSNESDTEDGATLTASVPPATSSPKPQGCVMALLTNVACNQGTSCSRETQATVTTGAKGTQCALVLLVSSSCQTYKEFSGGASRAETLPASGGGPHTCHTQSGNFSDDRLHTGEPYICPICQKSFAQKKYLVYHERMHSGKKPFTCGTCQRSFARRCSLTDHEKSHSGQKPYVCGVCQKSFHLKRLLVGHESIHSGKKPFTCGTCQRSFTRRYSLTDHEKSHSGQKPYVCGVCQKSFRLKRHLVGHESIHSGKKPFTCGTCQCSFAKRSNLARHEMTHSGQKPYVCGACQKNFSRKSDLVYHERLHSGERRYSCGTCQKHFPHRKHLVYHARLHSVEKP